MKEIENPYKIPYQDPWPNQYTRVMLVFPETGTGVLITLKEGYHCERTKISGRLLCVDREFVIIENEIVPDGWSQKPIPLRPAIHHDIHVLSISSISSLTSIPFENSGENNFALILSPPKPERLIRREVRALKSRQSQFASRAPPGTSEEGIIIFEALAKTLPCYWRREGDKSVMIVMDEVSISEPYVPSSCRGGMRLNSSVILERVRKVLAGERSRLGL